MYYFFLRHSVNRFLSQEHLFMSGNSGKWQIVQDVYMSNVMGQYKWLMNFVCCVINLFVTFCYKYFEQVHSVLEHRSMRFKDVICLQTSNLIINYKLIPSFAALVIKIYLILRYSMLLIVFWFVEHRLLLRIPYQTFLF